ncbi:MAG: 50S ribosomal protein L13 [Candidatus Liptonbacteria bacterium]|nr:50S ribosomal protein L13 [Candidatus Liptonbacteria bacterium]
MADIIIDVKNRPLGRAATEIALLLQGKKSPKYNPRLPGSDRVIIKNVGDIKVSGNKYEDKVYYRHTGYMGHLMEKTYRQAFEKDPSWVLRHSVRGMLPKNFLTDKRMRRLVIE